MLLPTPAREWISVSISSSMPLTIMASLEKGSSVFRCGNRSRKLPATMRCTRSLTSTIRLRARALNDMPTARQRSTAGNRPSASTAPTTRAISPTSATFRPITSTSPFVKLRAIRRTACFSRPFSSNRSATALWTVSSVLKSIGRPSRLPAILRPFAPNNPASRTRPGSCFKSSLIASNLRSDDKFARTPICEAIIRSDRIVKSCFVLK